MEFRNVCRYFLEGRCRFGKNCRNEHVFNNNNNRGGNNNELNDILWEIRNEVIVAEKGGQWPLTSFAPIQHCSGLPGWEDISPEEVRWTLYEARKNGTVNQALNLINQWYKNAEKGRNLVKQRSPEIANIIKKIINENQSRHTSSGNFPSSAEDAKSSFRFDVTSKNIFGKPTVPPQSTGNIFGGIPVQSGSSDSSNIFTRPQQQPSGQTIFSNGMSNNQNIFSANPGGVFNQEFSGSNATNENIFQTMSSTNIFQNSAFGGNNAFGEHSNIFTNGNVFQQSQIQTNQGSFNVPSFKTENVGFGVSNASVKEVDASVYSKIEDLNENEINSFTSTTFTFGNVPLKPPPQQYC